MEVEDVAVISHVPTQSARHVQLAPPEDFLAPRMQGHQFLRHLEDDFLDQAEIAVFDVAELHLAQQFFAQPPPRGVRMQQKLPLDVVPRLFPQPFTSPCQFL